MVTAEHVITERNGLFTTVTVARPEVHNAFDGAVVAERASAFEGLRAGAGIRRARVRAFLEERVPARRTEEA